MIVADHNAFNRGAIPTAMAIDERSHFTVEEIARDGLLLLEQAGIFVSVPHRKQCVLRVHLDLQHRIVHVAGEAYRSLKEKKILNHLYLESEAENGAPRVIKSDRDHPYMLFTYRLDNGWCCRLYLTAPLPPDTLRMFDDKGARVFYHPRFTVEDED
jgi:hypothetical protein